MPQSQAARPYRVGIVGAGGIAHAHGGACQVLDEVELVAICDVSPAALDRFGTDFGVEDRYLELDEMLAATNLDIGIISNWGALHAATGIRLAESGKVKAILCEKPFTSTAAEAEALVAAARDAGVLVAEAFKFRHHPVHQRARALIDSDAIGEVMSVRSTFFTGGTGAGLETRTPDLNWRFNKSQGGGSVNDLACYCIHHARFVFGEEPVRVTATGAAGIEVDDSAAILLEFAAGCSAQITVGFNSWSSQYVEIDGTKGQIRIDRAWNNENTPVDLCLWNLPDRSVAPEVIEIAPTDQFALQLQHLCDCLRTGAAHRIPPENSIAQMRVIDAVYESMTTHRSVEL
jgi:predicted dehydrogenase